MIWHSSSSLRYKMPSWSCSSSSSRFGGGEFCRSYGKYEGINMKWNSMFPPQFNSLHSTCPHCSLWRRVKKPATSTPRTFGGDLYIVAVVFIAQWISGDYLYDYSVQSIAKRSMWHCMPPYLTIYQCCCKRCCISFIIHWRWAPPAVHHLLLTTSYQPPSQQQSFIMDAAFGCFLREIALLSLVLVRCKYSGLGETTRQRDFHVKSQNLA